MAGSSPEGADAEAKIQRARIGLLLDHPFIASATMRLPIRDATGRAWCPTMATDGYGIYFDRNFVCQLSDPHLAGVIAHEVLHCVLGHADRRGEREPELWNAATDFAINGFLDAQGFALPPGLLNRDYRGMTSEEIYDLLRKPGKARSRSGSGEPFDTHLEPDDPRCSDLRAEDAPDAEERRQMRHGLTAEMGEHLEGLARALLQNEVQKARERKVDWRAVLRSHLTDTIKSDWRTYPYSKRLIHRGLYLPSTGIEAPSAMVFAIDTSGSMGSTQLGQAFAEIESLRQIFPCALTVIQCDMEIQSMTRFEAGDLAELPEIIRVSGRGGTDFRPLFRWITDEWEGSGERGPVIFFTDGYGTFPEWQPAVPVLWLLPEGSNFAGVAKRGALIRV
jgi:predicted metal-dependent peptidase